jgi:integrase
MNYPVSEGRYGLIYTIADGVKVTRTKPGYWMLVVYQKGERDRRTFDKTDEGLKKALQAGELYTAKIGLATLNPDAEKLLVLSDVAAEWLKSNKARWAYGTSERYSSLVRDFVNPMLGLMPIKKVARNHVKDLLTDTLAIRSPKTVELLHAVISGIFAEAIDRGYTNSNPASGLLKKVLPPKHKRNLSEPDPLTKGDLGKLLDASWMHLPLNLALVIDSIAYSGMRLGECLAMHRDHLDVTNCQYMVSETFKRERFGLPKAGKRLIDLPESLVERLEKFIKTMRKESMSEGKEVGYLFPGISQRKAAGAMKRACRYAKIRTRSPHDLRHTYATILLMEHYSPAYVQKQLGHHSITMTVDIYGHWIPGEGKKDLDQALSGRKLSPVPRVQLTTRFVEGGQQ